MKYLLTFFFISLIFQAFSQQADVKEYNIWPGEGGSHAEYLTIFKNSLYFVAGDSVHGSELHRIDAKGNLKLVSDLYPGVASGGAYSPSNNSSGVQVDKKRFAVSKDESGNDIIMYLQGNNGSTGWELFRYDTTMSMQMLEKELVPGIGSMANYRLSKDFISFKGFVFFACDLTTITKLYAYNIATKTVKAIDSSSSSIFNLTIYKDKIYYSSSITGFSSYDPVNDKVKRVASYFSTSQAIEYMHVVGDYLYFGTPGGAIAGLYQYNGTGIPVNVAGYCYKTGVRNNAWPIGDNKGNVYFPCSDNNGDCVLCEYNVVTKKVAKFSKAKQPTDFVSVDNVLYFCAKDTLTNFELWSYDGVASPKVALDLWPGILYYSRPTYITAFNKDVYFVAERNTNVGTEVYRYTPGATPTLVSSSFFNNQVKVFPNPTTDVCTVSVYLQSETIIKFAISDVAGKTVYTKDATIYPAGKLSVSIDLQGISAGVYYVRVLSANNEMLYTTKLLKQ